MQASGGKADAAAAQQRRAQRGQQLVQRAGQRVRLQRQAARHAGQQLKALARQHAAAV